MKTILIYILIGACFLASLPGFAQSSDNMKYYILYDISGSVGQIDSFHHLRDLALQTVRRSGTTLKSGNSFEFIFFGQETGTPQNIDFDLPALGLPLDYRRKASEVINKVQLLDSTNFKNKFTHIDAAITQLLSNIGKASAVFIFTDGQLLQGDIDHGIHPQYEDYKKKVKNDLEAIANKGIPLFIVQSSPETLNAYDYVERLDIGSEFASTDSFFWVDSKVKDISKAKSEFDSFLSNAHNTVIKSQLTYPVEQHDSVAMIVNLHQTFALLKVQNLTLSDLSSLALPRSSEMTIAIERTKEIQSIISSPMITSGQAIKVRNNINSLAASPGPSNTLRDALHKKAKEDGKFSMPARSAMNMKSSMTEGTTRVTTAQVVPKSEFDIEQAIVKGLADYIIKRSEQEAIIFLFEHVDKQTALMTPFVRDTLFTNTLKYLQDYKNHSDLLLVKEALQEDLNALPENLIKTKRLAAYDGLVGLAYAFELSKSLSKTGNLEEAFAVTSQLKKRIISLGPTVTSTERGILLTCTLIGILNQYQLSSPFNTLTAEDLNELSQMLIADFSSAFPDFQSIDSKPIPEYVKDIYSKYARIRQQIDHLDTLMKRVPTQDYVEFQKYSRVIYTDIVKQAIELLLAGNDLALSFRKPNESDQERATKINSSSKLVMRIIEGWFLIEDKEYTKAIMLLIPAIENFMTESPDIDSYMKEKLADLQQKLKEEKSQLRNETVIVDYNRMSDLYVRVSKYAHLGDTLGKYNDLALTDAQYKQRLSALGLAELQILIANARIDTATLNQAIKFLRTTPTSDPVRFKKMDMSFNFPAKFAFQYITFPELSETLRTLISVSAEVSTSTDAKGITNTLTKYALPPTSYRIKREVKHSLMINAYGAGGVSLLENGHASFVVSAPVGLEFSTRWLNRRGSVSVFLSPLDVGNVINYELIGDDSKSDQDVFSWSNIYSPGAFLVFGLSKQHPFSIGVGRQWNNPRTTLFVGFDLPIIRIR